MEKDVAVTGFNPVSLMPTTFEQKLKMAQTLVKSGMLPQSLNTPEKVCVALEWGHELQLSPMVAVNNITVINGKPTLSADLMGALVRRSPDYGGIEWTCLTDEKAECVISRLLPNGKQEKYTSTFTIEEAQKAGLTGKDVWRKYPKRMLKHRCMSYGLRDVFPDLLAGLYEPEEMESITPSEVPQERNITEESTSVTYVEPNCGEPVENTEEVAYVKTDREKLGELLTKYEQSINPKYYEICCSAMAGDSDAVISDCLKRLTDYLGKKGMKVA